MNQQETISTFQVKVQSFTLSPHTKRVVSSVPSTGLEIHLRGRLHGSNETAQILCGSALRGSSVFVCWNTASSKGFFLVRFQKCAVLVNPWIGVSGPLSSQGAIGHPTKPPPLGGFSFLYFKLELRYLHVLTGGVLGVFGIRKPLESVCEQSVSVSGR